MGKLGIERVILVVEVLKLQESNTCDLGFLGGEGGLHELCDTVAQVQESVLISNSLQVLKLSVTNSLECLKELTVEVLEETHERREDCLFNIQC